MSSIEMKIYIDLIPKGNFALIHDAFVSEMKDTDATIQSQAAAWGRMAGYLYALLDAGVITPREFNAFADYYDEYYRLAPHPRTVRDV